MKKILLISFLFMSLNLFSQDVIVKRDGSTIISKVLEVTQTEVKYKKLSNLEGPLYTIDKANIMAINYENGEKDVFDIIEAQKSDKPQTAKGGIAEPKKGGNEGLIKFYNEKDVQFDIKEKNKKTYIWAGLLGVDESSVMESNSLRAYILQQQSCLLNTNGYHICPFNGHFYFKLENTSDRTVYVDLGNTFRVQNNGDTKVYFNSNQISVSHGSGSSVGLNVGSVASALGIGGVVGTLAGGVSVGSNSGSSYTKTYVRDRILAIPPGGMVDLERCEWEHVKGNALYKMENYVYKSYCEGFNYSTFYLDTDLKVGEVKTFKYENSPQSFRYTITYSHDADFSNWEALDIKVYIRKMVGGFEIYKSYNKILKQVKGFTTGTIIIGRDYSY